MTTGKIIFAPSKTAAHWEEPPNVSPSENMTLKDDRSYIWHPFTQAQTAADAIPISKARGLYLESEDGKQYMDLISSWWVTIHGHSHPHIAQAIYEQAKTLEHVMFAQFTHSPATTLAKQLIQRLPPGFQKVFYSDSGSAAIEVALKLAYQYWFNKGEKNRKRFAALCGGYHGDTFGAMSAGQSSGFHSAFKDLLFPVESLPFPETWDDDKTVDLKEAHALQVAGDYFKQYGETVAALIVEPFIQGAAGMRFCRPGFIQDLVSLAKKYGALIIFDEIMTGFGRTGTLFACEQVTTRPDIICLSKGLTGGFLPLSATICTLDIFEAFLGDSFSTALAHGHSFTGNPLGCAAALASLELWDKNNCLNQIKIISEIHKKNLNRLKIFDWIIKIRHMGPVAAWSFCGHDRLSRARLFGKKSIENGLVIRPLQENVYLIPPYCAQEADLLEAYEKILFILNSL